MSGRERAFPWAEGVSDAGMTLREWYIGKAIEGICHGIRTPIMVDAAFAEEAAKSAIMIADAVMRLKDKIEGLD